MNVEGLVAEGETVEPNGVVTDEELTIEHVNEGNVPHHEGYHSHHAGHDHSGIPADEYHDHTTDMEAAEVPASFLGLASHLESAKTKHRHGHKESLTQQSWNPLDALRGRNDDHAHHHDHSFLEMKDVPMARPAPGAAPSGGAHMTPPGDEGQARMTPAAAGAAHMPAGHGAAPMTAARTARRLSAAQTTKLEDAQQMGGRGPSVMDLAFPTTRSMQGLVKEHRGKGHSRAHSSLAQREKGRGHKAHASLAEIGAGKGHRKAHDKAHGALADMDKAKGHKHSSHVEREKGHKRHTSFAEVGKERKKHSHLEAGRSADQASGEEEAEVLRAEKLSTGQVSAH